ncbi:MAG: hypothetical protein O7B26_05240 [Planctomycetota bacterium]|nr:hypothetical protein [Planctomycetota bacterium]
MGTESFDPERVILAMRYSTEVYRQDIETSLSRLACISPDEAEHLVAIAGEDEAAYSVRDRASFVSTICRTADEFLADDEGGYRDMTVYLTSHVRSEAIREFWFHVTGQGSEGSGVWFRQLVVGIDTQKVFAAMGDRPSKAGDG